MGSVTTPRLNVRSGPGPDSYIVFRISQGDIIRIIGRNSESSWLQIDVGIVGWINSENVSVQGSILLLPVRDSRSPVPTPAVQMSFTCSGARGPSFQINDRFVVPEGDGPTSVYAEPGREPRLVRVPEGGGGVILGDPICTGAQEGYLVWWYVRTDQGIEGYISEGYLHSPIAWIAPDN